MCCIMLTEWSYGMGTNSFKAGPLSSQLSLHGGPITLQKKHVVFKCKVGVDGHQNG